MSILTTNRDIAVDDDIALYDVITKLQGRKRTVLIFKHLLEFVSANLQSWDGNK